MKDWNCACSVLNLKSCRQAVQLMLLLCSNLWNSVITSARMFMVSRIWRILAHRFRKYQDKYKWEWFHPYCTTLVGSQNIFKQFFFCTYLNNVTHPMIVCHCLYFNAPLNPDADQNFTMIRIKPKLEKSSALQLSECFLLHFIYLFSPDENIYDFNEIICQPLARSAALGYTSLHLFNATGSW